jgi:hypothetical protein
MYKHNLIRNLASVSNPSCVPLINHLIPLGIPPWLYGNSFLWAFNSLFILQVPPLFKANKVVLLVQCLHLLHFWSWSVCVCVCVCVSLVVGSMLVDPSLTYMMKATECFSLSSFWSVVKCISLTFSSFSLLLFCLVSLSPKYLLPNKLPK